MADFGTTSIGGSNDNPSLNYVWLKATSNPASNGTLDSISVRAANKLPLNASICLALYTDSAGAPNALVQANETPITITDATGVFAWRTQTGFNAAITSGTQYWFAIRVSDWNSSDRDVDVKDTTNGGATELYFKDNTALAAFPATVTGATSATNARWSIFGTYTPAAGASPFFGTTGVDVPRPMARSSQLLSWVSSFTIDDNAPFAQRTWPNPVRARARVQDWTASISPALVVIPGVPFAQSTWPNPMRAIARAQDWATPVGVLRLPHGQPFGQDEWPNPVRARLRPIDWTLGLDLARVVAPDVLPIRQAAWPRPIGMPAALVLQGFVQASAFRMLRDIMPFTGLASVNPIAVPFPAWLRGSTQAALTTAPTPPASTFRPAWAVNSNRTVGF